MTTVQLQEYWLVLQTIAKTIVELLHLPTIEKETIIHLCKMNVAGNECA